MAQNKDLNEVLRNSAGQLSGGPESDLARLWEAVPVGGRITGESTPALERVQAGAARRGSNIVAGVDEKGQLVIAGSGSAARDERIVPSSSITGQVQQTPAINSSGTMMATPSDFYSSFSARKKEIEAMGDIPARMNAKVELAGQVAAHIAQATQGIYKTAEGVLNLPQLEKSLAENEAADRRSPNYARFLSDSTMTAKVRADVEQARRMVGGKTQELLDQSPELNRLNAEAKMFFQKEDALLGNMAQKQQTQSLKEMDDIYKAGSNGIAVARALDPALDTDVRAAQYFNDNKSRDRVLMQLADNWDNPTALVGIAIATESGKAVQALAYQQAAAMGGGDKTLFEAERRKAIADIDTLMRDATNPARRDAMLKLAYPTEKARKDALNSLAQQTLTASPSESADIQSKFYGNAALTAMARVRAADLKGNVDNWDAATRQNLTQDVDFAGMIAQARAEGMQPSLEVLAGKLNLIPDLVKRTQLREKLMTYTKSAISHNNQGIIGKVDQFEVLAPLQVAAIRTGLKGWEAAGQALSTGFAY